MDPLWQPLGRCPKRFCGGTLFLCEDQWGRIRKCVSCGRTDYLAPEDPARVEGARLARVLPLRVTTFRRKAA